MRQLKPEDKVNIAISMTDVCVNVCVEGIRAEHRTIGENELAKKLRERLDYVRQMHQQWRREI